MIGPLSRGECRFLLPVKLDNFAAPCFDQFSIDAIQVALSLWPQHPIESGLSVEFARTSRKYCGEMFRVLGEHLVVIAGNGFELKFRCQAAPNCRGIVRENRRDGRPHKVNFPIVEAGPIFFECNIAAFANPAHGLLGIGRQLKFFGEFLVVLPVGIERLFLSSKYSACGHTRDQTQLLVWRQVSKMRIGIDHHEHTGIFASLLHAARDFQNNESAE